MMIISDASPIIALSNIDQLALLQAVYGEVYVTDIVKGEIGISLPDWLKVRNDYDIALYRSLCTQLDEGEASSIALGVKMETKSILIIDEKRGRRIASELGLAIIGLLGVVVKAKKEGKIAEALPIIESLEQNGFRISSRIKAIIKAKLEEG